MTLEVERRRLGRSELTLPRIALGCGNFGGVGSAPELFGEGMTDDEALALMDAAWELGIAHFDTADAYGGGRSERAIGRWIRSRGVVPMLTTKTYNPMDVGADHGLAPERVVRQLESSLERLGVEQVDLYLAHEFDRDVPLEETFGAFDELQASERLRAYGVSNFGASQLQRALSVGSPAAVQNEYSLLARLDERDVLPLCAERELSYLAFSPLSGGWLTGKYRRGEPFPAGSRMTQRPGPYRALVSDEVFGTLDRIDALARERGISMAGFALAWLLADDRVTRIAVGPARPEHLLPVREALEHPLSAEDRIEVEGVFA
jgi:aryl-alcohol dehydrogenase-like predicted oxidoreductase